MSTSGSRSGRRPGSRRPTPLHLVHGVLVALSVTAALAACSGTGSDSGAGDASEPGRGAASSSERGAADADLRGVPAESDGSARDLASAPQVRATINKGTVSLSSDDVRTARQDVQRVLDAHDGSISEEQTETDDDGELSYVRLVARVPAKSFGDTMAALEEIATFRTSDRGSEDVTTQVIDNDVRVRAQQASLRRVETLLARADSLKEIIWIESQLTQRQAELDSLKSQQSWLADQTSLSTITLDITRTPETARAAEKDDDGFLAGLAGGWKALSGTATVLATVAGALLPFVVVGLAIGLPVWFVVRRSRARRRTAGVGEA